jgi:histidinol-phosphatase
MTNDHFARWLPLLSEIADRADAIALKYFRAPDLRVDEKADLSPVTEADRAIEDATRALIKSRYPEMSVFGEEQGEDGDSGGPRLIVDPIDATRNYLRGIPIFATLLAVEIEREIVVGLVSAPALNTRWHAARDAGAFCGSRPLQVSAIGDLGRGQAFGDLGGAVEDEVALLALLRQADRARGFGDFYQHMLVAEGAGEVAVDPIVSPWDIAAVQVIVEEAGGKATTLSGERSIYGGSLVTSNGLLHAEALGLLRSST